MKSFIDFGASQVRLTEDGQRVRTVPSVLMTMKDGRGVAFGEDAAAAIERAYDKIIVKRPMAKGRIADPDPVAQLLKLIVGKGRGQLFMTIPAQTADYERKELVSAARSMGFGKVALVEEIAAHAAGVGRKCPGTVSLVLVVGAAYAQAGVLKDGEVILSRSIRSQNPIDGAAGDAFVENLRRGIRVAHGLRIGSEQAERVLQTSERSVSGFSEQTGKAESVRLTDDEIRKALDYPLGQLSDLLTAVLDEGVTSLGDELRASVSRNGVLLSGGGAMLPWLEKELRERTKQAFVIPENPREAAIRGLVAKEART